jgi:DNA-binding winged helix-turn-helix (wHTH) protein
MSKHVNEVYKFGSFKIDARERLLSRNGEPIAVTPKPFDTLLVLVRNSGHLMLKDELMKAVWPDSFVEEVNLSQNVCALRRALGDTAHESRYIATVPGMGYRFVAEVQTDQSGVDEQRSLVVEQDSTSQIAFEQTRSWRFLPPTTTAIITERSLRSLFNRRFPPSRSSRWRLSPTIPSRSTSWKA